MDNNMNNPDLDFPHGDVNNQMQETNGEEIDDQDFLEVLNSLLEDDDEISVTINQNGDNGPLIDDEDPEEVDNGQTGQEDDSSEDYNQDGILGFF
ncbi:MAG: hypothetical protein IKR05_11630 [Prevotella sp.]|nr:hypothetical protein [Prevotella sp.]MBR6263850.1 hypothetical protein [Prevotella sp.]